MPNLAPMWNGFVISLREGWGNFMTIISTLSTMQLLLIIGGIIAGIWVVKVIFSPGGARRRMKGMAAVWVMIPFIVGIGGVILYFVVKALAMSPQVMT
jgi:hypothetical protein